MSKLPIVVFVDWVVGCVVVIGLVVVVVASIMVVAGSKLVVADLTVVDVSSESTKKIILNSI